MIRTGTTRKTERLLAIDRLRARVAAVWRPVPPTPAAAWCSQRVRVAAEQEASRGEYDLTERPWWTEVLTAATDPSVAQVTIEASPQVGKTLTLIALLLYLAEQSPASAFVLLPNKTATIDFRDRLYSAAHESGFDLPPEYRWNLRYAHVGAMRVYLAWSGSRQGARSRRAKYIFLTECDVYLPTPAGDPVEQAKQRAKAYSRSLVLAESSPIPDPSRIDRLEHESDRRRWWGTCPECGREQEVRFFPHADGELAGRGGVCGLKDGRGNWLDADAVRLSAHYVCEAGCVLREDQKRALVSRGGWVPMGCRLERGKLVGTPSRSGRHAGFRLWAAHSAKTWGEMAAEYVRAITNGTLPDFFQNWLGRCWKIRGTLPTWQELGGRLAGPTARGVVPAWAWFLTASVDVQLRELYVAVRAWGGARTSSLVDWWVIQRDPGDEADLVKSDFLALTDTVFETQFPVDGTNPRGRASLPIALLVCDTKYRTLDVHEWIVHCGRTKRIRAVQGDGGMRSSVRFKSHTVYESRRKKEGKPVEYSGGLELWSINSTAYRLDLIQKWSGQADAPGAWLLPADVIDTGQYYLQQLLNEPPVTRRGKDGRPEVVFQERNSEIGHDFWDVEVNQLAAADMFVAQLPKQPGWDAAQWAAAIPAAPGKRDDVPRPATRAAR